MRKKSSFVRWRSGALLCRPAWTPLQHVISQATCSATTGIDVVSKQNRWQRLLLQCRFLCSEITVKDLLSIMQLRACLFFLHSQDRAPRTCPLYLANKLGACARTFSTPSLATHACMCSDIETTLAAGDTRYETAMAKFCYQQAFASAKQ